jgi:hypothetical protein
MKRRSRSKPAVRNAFRGQRGGAPTPRDRRVSDLTERLRWRDRGSRRAPGQRSAAAWACLRRLSSSITALSQSGLGRICRRALSPVRSARNEPSFIFASGQNGTMSLISMRYPRSIRGPQVLQQLNRRSVRSASRNGVVSIRPHRGASDSAHIRLSPLR